MIKIEIDDFWKAKLTKNFLRLVNNGFVMKEFIEKNFSNTFEQHFYLCVARSCFQNIIKTQPIWFFELEKYKDQIEMVIMKFRDAVEVESTDGIFRLMVTEWHDKGHIESFTIKPAIIQEYSSMNGFINGLRSSGLIIDERKGRETK